MLKIRELAVRRDIECVLRVLNASLRAIGYQVEVRVVECEETETGTFTVDLRLVVKRGF